MTLVPSQTPIQWVELALYLGVKWPVHKADYLLLSSANIKNGHSYTECHRRKGPNFRRVFLTLNYTDITQNTYTQS